MPSHQRRSSINLARSNFLTQNKVVSLAASEKCQPFFFLCSFIPSNPLGGVVQLVHCKFLCTPWTEPNRNKNTCDWQARVITIDRWKRENCRWCCQASAILTDTLENYCGAFMHSIVLRMDAPHTSLECVRPCRGALRWSTQKRFVKCMQDIFNSELSWNLLTKYIWLSSKWSFSFNLFTVLTHQTAHAIFSSLNSTWATCNSIAKIQLAFDNNICGSFWQ